MKLAKSGGVLSRSPDARRKARQEKLKEYEPTAMLVLECEWQPIKDGVVMTASMMFHTIARNCVGVTTRVNEAWMARQVLLRHQK